MHARGLDRIDEYADGIGPHKRWCCPGTPAPSASPRPSSVTPTGAADRPCLDRPAENRFLPTNLRRGDSPDALGDMAGEVRALLAAGVDGVITDHPEEALSVVREQTATAVG